MPIHRAGVEGRPGDARGMPGGCPGDARGAPGDAPGMPGGCPGMPRGMPGDAPGRPGAGGGPGGYFLTFWDKNGARFPKKCSKIVEGMTKNAISELMRLSNRCHTKWGTGRGSEPLFSHAPGTKMT